MARVCCTLTRRQPPGWSGYACRVNPAMLRDCLAELAKLAARCQTAAAPLCYVCGPTGFVETTAESLLAIGLPESQIRTERFGPTS